MRIPGIGFASWTRARRCALWVRTVARFPAALQRARLLAGNVPAQPAAPRAPGGRVLLAGDSLALGVGAVSPESALGGRIAADFPEVALEYVAVVGARVADIEAQLACSRHARYAAVVITVGGNDILRMTGTRFFLTSLQRVLARAQQMTGLVIAASSANVGGAPLFPWPLGILFDRRSRAVRGLIAAACRTRGAVFMNYIFDVAEDPFARDTLRYYAADRIHPSDSAYALCYEMLKRGTPLAERLRRLG